jgi:hypothetical protein
MSSTVDLLVKTAIRPYLSGLLKICAATQLTSLLRGNEREGGWISYRVAKKVGRSTLEDSARNRPPFDKENEFKRGNAKLFPWIKD